MFKVTCGLSLVAAVISLVSPTPTVAQSRAHDGALFVMTNNADKNEIISYERATNGLLSGGEHYATEGRGSGGTTDPLEAQGSLTLSQDHSILFAANAGSGNISVFSVQHSALILLNKVPSGGSQPVAVAEHQNLVYVLNSGGAGSVVGFTLDFGGQLKQIKDSTMFLTATVTGGASLAFSPDGKFLVVTERLANNIDIFHVLPNGTLSPIIVNPSPAPGAFSVNFAPEGNAIVSETGAAGATNGSAISSYKITTNGKLSPISQSVPTFGSANCWNVVTPDGKFVYVSNAGSATISGFAIGSNGALTPIGGTVVGNNPEGATNLDIAVSADGKYLYTLNSATGNVGVFGIRQDGALINLGTAGDFAKSAGFNGIAAL
ncbi:lactonase family protein [Granulicella mallensis]|uniref:Lactonase, 7-bladed beta propeller n=1 Tax=Granulicella mallensis (strain ATCC BAA-1857 / DSM 23137 / MP5ACTX8) TaxID=682795 RepID=G8NTH6_GRAMM|nr:beta-propeller fold lactonase family protein [Granulicella mallensis]AEU35208.1 Lactonase, 7-bladed beta propeller [Granulicella mallensis MP5ACTX8]